MMIKAKEQAGRIWAILGVKKHAGRLTGFRISAAVFCAVVSVEAELIQHLDASIFSSVIGSNPVTQWNDQSGKNNHAVKKDNAVTYPGAGTFSSGLSGLQFGASVYSSMTLFSSDSWLNQTSGNGFCVLVAFKVDALNPGSDSDVLGNDDAVNSGALGLRYAPDGTMETYLGGLPYIKSGSNDKKIVNGDTLIWAINYNPRTTILEFWDSKNYDSLIKQVWPGNFSKGQAVTLGYSGHSGRFLNGLVGEVKIYNAALGADQFKAEREAMSTKWANIANMAEINWRVIPEDPNYPTDELITAAISVTDTNLNNRLPDDPANTDCTATFQEAIDTVSQANGGTVWIPEGEYCFTNNLVLRSGVSLRGRWDRPSATGWNPGTVLKIYHGEGGTTNDTAFLTTGGSAPFHIKDLTFWHPNQSPTNITPYPYVIMGLGGPGTYENLTFVNAYRGLNQDAAGFGLVRGLYGTMLETGLMSDHGAAVPRFESLYSGPQYWEWWPLDHAVANPGQTGNYAQFMMNSGTFFRIQNQDVFSFYNADISGYSVGMVLENSDGSSLDDGNVPNHGQISGVKIHNCKIAVHAKVGNFSSGLKSSFSGTQYGIYSTTGGDIPLTECVVSGGVYAVYSQGGNFGLNARSCQIAGTVRFENGDLELKACNFTKSGTHISATSGIDRGIVWGCTYNSNQTITIVGSNYLDSVDHTLLNFKPIPPYSIDPLTDYNTVRKPSKTNLYNVVEYGATGDGVTDDTAAVTAALNAAKSNGGGIVFFPFGDFGRYRVTENLDLGTGVELRGVGTRGDPSDWKGQSIILVEKTGTAEGTAFITMGDNCGVRNGLLFFYPANNWKRILDGGQSFTPFPYTIRATGTNNYVIACGTPNAYQFLDLDGAKDALVDMMLTGGLKNTYRVRGNAKGCRFMTGHVKPSGMWGWLTDIPNNKANYTKFGQETTKTLNLFDLDDCEDLTILAIFCREANKTISCNGAQGVVVGTAGEAVQRGFCFERAGAKPLYMIDTKPNMSEHGDGLGKPGILVEPTYNSPLDIIGGAEQGAADYKFQVLSGDVYSQSRKNVNSGWAQYREVYVGNDAKLTLYDNILDKPFSLHVESNAMLKIERSYLSAGIPYATIDGTLEIIKSDINQNYIMSVPGQNQFSEHGLILDRSNTTRVTNQWSYSQKLTSGNSFNLNVTEPAYTNGKVKSIYVEVGIYPGSSGSNTVTIYYNATGNSEKVGATATFTALDGKLEVLTFSKTDAFFGSATSDIRVQLSTPSKAAGLSYVSIRGNPAIEPPFDLKTSSGGHFVSLDWKGKSHWKFSHYNVYRSTVSGGPYTKIATNVTATALMDTNVTLGTAYYYAIRTVDSSGVETVNSREVSGKASLYVPVIRFTTPSSNSTVAVGSDLYVNVETSSTNGVSDVSLYKDDVLIRTDTSAPYEWCLAGETNDLPLRNLQAGTFVLKAVVKDTLDNTAETYLNMTVENPPPIAPVVSFYTPSSNITVMAGTNLYVKVNATDPDGISQVRLYKNGVQLVRSEGKAPYEWALASQNDPELKNLAAGSFVLTAQATDSLGNIGQTPAGITVTVLPVTYTLTVNNGSGDGNYVAGSNVWINADVAPTGQVFDSWVLQSGVATFADLYSATTTLTLSNTAVTVLATYKAAPNGYEEWASINSVGVAMADDDGDGRKNLLEYAIGGNPKAGGDSTDPVIVQTGSTLGYSYQQRNDDPGLTYVLQGCTNLISPVWIDLVTTVITNSTAGEYDEVTRPIPVTDAHMYIRLQVTQPN